MWQQRRIIHVERRTETVNRKTRTKLSLLFLDTIRLQGTTWTRHGQKPQNCIIIYLLGAERKCFDSFLQESVNPRRPSEGLKQLSQSSISLFLPRGMIKITSQFLKTLHSWKKCSFFKIREPTEGVKLWPCYFVEWKWTPKTFFTDEKSSDKFKFFCILLVTCATLKRANLAFPTSNDGQISSTTCQSNTRKTSLTSLSGCGQHCSYFSYVSYTQHLFLFLPCFVKNYSHVQKSLSTSQNVHFQRSSKVIVYLLYKYILSC